MAMKAKDRHRIKLLEYLGNPENDWPNKLYMNNKVIFLPSLLNSEAF